MLEATIQLQEYGLQLGTASTKCHIHGYERDALNYLKNFEINHEDTVRIHFYTKVEIVRVG